MSITRQFKPPMISCSLTYTRSNRTYQGSDLNAVNRKLSVQQGALEEHAVQLAVAEDVCHQQVSVKR
jgi:hypothetical protein